MLGEKRFAPKLVYHFNLEERVPPDHLLRRVAEAGGFPFVCALTARFYSRTGQPGAGPVVLFKRPAGARLLGHRYRITSERRLAEECRPNLAFMWFLRFDVDELTSDHSVLSRARARFGHRPHERRRHLSGVARRLPNLRAGCSAVARPRRTRSPAPTRRTCGRARAYLTTGRAKIGVRRRKRWAESAMAWLKETHGCRRASGRANVPMQALLAARASGAATKAPRPSSAPVGLPRPRGAAIGVAGSHQDAANARPAVTDLVGVRNTTRQQGSATGPKEGACSEGTNY